MASKLIFACQSMQALAASLDFGTGTTLRKINWQRFKDNYPDLFIPQVEDIRGRDIYFLANFENPSDIFEQLSVIYALPRYGARSLTVILPYFPTATKDRVDQEGEIVTAKTLARMLSATPLSMHGPVRLIVFDIHALQERFYFDDNIVPQMATAIPLLKVRLTSLPDDYSIAFPDEGAWKRFHKQFAEYPQIICHKIRQGEERIVTIKEGESRGRHVVIVDDLVMTGGTLYECAQVCLSTGAAKVSAYVTHPVFPQESWKRFTPDKGKLLENFWITDSCPGIANAIGHNLPFEVLSLSSIIAKLI